VQKHIGARCHLGKTPLFLRKKAESDPKNGFRGLYGNGKTCKTYKKCLICDYFYLVCYIIFLGFVIK